jgi:hypothetical protein
MDADFHPDPFTDAAQAGLRHAMELIYSAGAGAQIYLHHKKTQARIAAEREEKTRRALNAQIRAEGDAARVGWAPVLDPQWLAQTDLLHTARAWNAAMPYAERAVPWYEPAAATAMRKCEERLRILHPYAMARYDRLRGDGMAPAEAMRETAPLFTRPAYTRDGFFSPRPALEPANGAQAGQASGPQDREPGEPASTAVLEHRGRQIINALQAQARTQGRDPLSEAGQRTVLETITGLPNRVIDRVVQGDASAGLVRAEESRAAGAERVRAADLDAAADLTATPAVDERTVYLTGARDATAAAAAAGARAARLRRPWELDFPLSIKEVVGAVVGRRELVTAGAPALMPSPVQGRGARR